MINDPSLKNIESIWLKRYMKMTRWDNWFKPNSFSIQFSRLDTFNDTLEGFLNASKCSQEAWQQYIGHFTRVITSGGKIVSGAATFDFLTELFKSPDNNPDSIKVSLETYLASIESTHASCWFMSTDPLSDEMYMWDIYARDKSNDLHGFYDVSFMISISLKDLIERLRIHETKFECGIVNYEDSCLSNPFFFKHPSYRHEKEFRIICQHFEKEFVSVELSDLRKNIIFSQPLNDQLINKVESTINKSTDKISLSNLPIQFRLSNLRKYLNS